MPYAATILADSLSPDGVRLTTMQLTYPRFVHAEFMTHRVFSRNSASSRAIPIQQMISQVMEDPAGPVWWGKNQKGMQAEEELEGADFEQAKHLWLRARDEAVFHAAKLISCHAHKQIVNRLLEPWMWITVIASATNWENFFGLRCHPAAQPEIRRIAEMAKDLYDSPRPYPMEYHEWHMPLMGLDPDDDLLYGWEQITDTVALPTKVAVAVGRCARVSYLTHDGKRDPEADVDLCRRLASMKHWSPFEHVAAPVAGSDYHGNFRGWFQARKKFPWESGQVE